MLKLTVKLLVLSLVVFFVLAVSVQQAIHAMIIRLRHVVVQLVLCVLVYVSLDVFYRRHIKMARVLCWIDPSSQ